MSLKNSVKSPKWSSPGHCAWLLLCLEPLFDVLYAVHLLLFSCICSAVCLEPLFDVLYAVHLLLFSCICSAVCLEPLFDVLYAVHLLLFSCICSAVCLKPLFDVLYAVHLLLFSCICSAVWLKPLFDVLYAVHLLLFSYICSAVCLKPLFDIFDAVHEWPLTTLQHHIAVDDHVEALRQWGVGGAGVVVHVIHQEATRHATVVQMPCRSKSFAQRSVLCNRVLHDGIRPVIRSVSLGRIHRHKVRHVHETLHHRTESGKLCHEWRSGAASKVDHQRACRSTVLQQWALIAAVIVPHSAVRCWLAQPRFCEHVTSYQPTPHHAQKCKPPHEIHVLHREGRVLIPGHPVGAEPGFTPERRDRVDDLDHQPSPRGSGQLWDEVKEGENAA